MIIDFEKKIHELAEVMVKKGVVLKKGQTVVIRSSIEGATIAREVARVAFEEGAKEVYTQWNDEISDKIKCENESLDILKQVSNYDGEKLYEYAVNDCCFIKILAPDPDLYADVSLDAVNAMFKANKQTYARVDSMRMNGTCKWTSVAVPTYGWAKKVFPQLPIEEAYDRLWNEYFDICRITVGKSVENWDKHTANLTARANYLTEKQLKTLVYHNKYGTDVTMALAEDHLWVGGTLMSKEGTPFVPNIPTEEVATAPHLNGVDGIFASTKPLVHNSQVIPAFTLTLKEGKIVAMEAGEEYDHLKSIVDTDEYSCRLGEVALVPYDSPISNKNLLFYHTLFDENASCHIAIGRGYPVVLKNAANMNDSDCEKRGLNTNSLVHVDFMVGSEDLSVIGYDAAGVAYDIFKDGNWAF